MGGLSEGKHRAGLELCRRWRFRKDDEGRDNQTLAEVFYWKEVGWGGPVLVHDEEAQAFYTPDGELAVSRNRVGLRHMFDGMRDAEE